jgi:hypothetical protein
VYDEGDPLLNELRGVCLQLPESAEMEAWGRPTFRAGKRIFAVCYASAEEAHAVIFKPDPAEETSLRADERFFIPPYWPKWLALDLSGQNVDFDEVAELVESSYRQVALKRMLTALEDVSADG